MRDTGRWCCGVSGQRLGGQGAVSCVSFDSVGFPVPFFGGRPGWLAVICLVVLIVLLSGGASPSWADHPDCTAAAGANGDLRLCGTGHTTHQGRVEVYLDGQWGTICDDFWDLKDARVVCLQLGLGPAYKAVQEAGFGQGTHLPILLDDVNCDVKPTENEDGKGLLKCEYLTQANCHHTEDAGVACQTESPTVFLSRNSLTVTEQDSAGATYSVWLGKKPDDDVTVTIGGTSGTDVRVSRTSLTFMPSNWSTAQTVRVTAEGDADQADDPLVTLTHTASMGGYGDAEVENLSVTVEDDDVPGVRVIPRSLTVREQNTSGRTYEVVLTGEPTNNVTITVGGTSGTDVTATPSMLTFTPDNWDTTQLVRVTAAADPDDNSESVTLTHSATGGGYGSLQIDSVSVEVFDDDISVKATPQAITVAEGESESYELRPEGGPWGSLTVSVEVPPGSGVSANPSEVTFTRGNWSAPKTITVTARQDAGNDTVTIAHSVAGSSTVQTDSVSVTTQGSNTQATGQPTISGTARVGVTLTASTSGIMDADGLTSVTYTYQWLRVEGGTETAIAGATRSTYTLVAADEGKQVKVRVTFTDDGGAQETRDSAVTAVVASLGTGGGTGTGGGGGGGSGGGSGGGGGGGGSGGSGGSSGGSDALAALYTATDGPNWTDNTNWLSTAPLGDWYGVTTDSDGHVTELNLSNNNLIGTIPAELGQLVNLAHLYLRLNALSGPIPAELGQLTNLRRLNLNYNALSGSIPIELGQLTNLQYLYLQGNALSGSIPIELGQLTNLQLMDLHNNDLSGSIPAELSTLAALKDLKLYNNAALSGPIPDSFPGSLASLREVEIQNTQMTVPETAAFQTWKDSIETVTEGTQTSTASIVLARANAAPTGLWSDGTTLWVADVGTAQVFAYSLATGAPVPAHAIELGAANAAPTGLWSDGTTLWVADVGTAQVFAYSLATGAPVPAHAIELGAANAAPTGLWSDGTTLWVADVGAAQVFAYSLATGAPVSDKNIMLPDSNASPRGLWSDDETLWVTDAADDRVYAYRLADGSRAKGKASLLAPANIFPRDLWSDGGTLWVVDAALWVADSAAGMLYAYSLETALLVGALENPGPDSFQSGIGVLSGWVCDGATVTIEINGSAHAAAYGTERVDTADICGDTDNGFGLLFNWNLLDDGEHAVVAYVDDVELDRATVTVTTLGGEFVPDVEGSCPVPDFPTVGETVTVEWQESKQNFVIASGVAPTGENRAGATDVGYLENPSSNSFQSGIGVLSGWVCAAEEVVIAIGHLAPQVAGYGTERLDTQDACGDTNNGFGLLFNWNLLDDGEHEVVAYVDDVELGRATVRVTTLGEEFLRGAEGECVIEDFPMLGETVTLAWQQNQQNFVVTAVE